VGLNEEKAESGLLPVMNLIASPQLQPAPRGQQDKQLRGIALGDVLQKRQLDQALNAKECAVLAGMSYSSARDWFRSPGFPVFRGVVFWGDFAAWRISQNQSRSVNAERETDKGGVVPHPLVSLPQRAARMLLEVG